MASPFSQNTTLTTIDVDSDGKSDFELTASLIGPSSGHTTVDVFCNSIKPNRLIGTNQSPYFLVIEYHAGDII